MGLDISRLFGGYTRSWALRYEDRARIKSGNPPSREFIAYTCSPSLLPVSWSKRDLITPEQKSFYENKLDYYFRTAVEIIDKVMQEIKEPSSRDVFSSTASKTKSEGACINDGLDEGINELQENFSKITGCLPGELPPFIVFPIAKRYKVSLAARYKEFKRGTRPYEILEDAVSRSIKKVQIDSVDNHIAHLLRSKDPSDLANAMLYASLVYPYCIYGLRAGCPSLNLQCEDGEVLLTDTARLSQNVWLTQCKNLDPIFRSEVSGASDDDYVIVGAGVVESHHERKSEFLILPFGKAFHIKEVGNSVYPKINLLCGNDDIVANLTFTVTSNGVLVQNTFEERNANLDLRCYIDAANTNLERGRNHEAMFKCLLTRDVLKQIKARKINLRDENKNAEAEFQTLKDRFRDIVVSSENILGNTSKNKPLRLSFDEWHQVVPYAWVKYGFSSQDPNNRRRIYYLQGDLQEDMPTASLAYYYRKSDIEDLLIVSKGKTYYYVKEEKTWHKAGHFGKPEDCTLVIRADKGELIVYKDKRTAKEVASELTPGGKFQNGFRNRETEFAGNGAETG